MAPVIGIQEILALFAVVLMLAIPLAFVGFLVTACIRRKTVWWVLTGITGAITLFSAIPVLFIGARAWKDGADRAEAAMQEMQMELEAEKERLEAERERLEAELAEPQD